MRAAELGRHGAVAGLCAVALSGLNDASRRSYYLAKRAEYRGKGSRALYGAPIRFSARVADRGKREARELVEARVGDARGDKVMDLDVAYAVIGDKTFERLFAAHRREGLRLASFEPLPEQAPTWRGKMNLTLVPAHDATLSAALDRRSPNRAGRNGA